MPEPIWGAGAATLPDGRVMVLGGTTGPDSYQALATTEIFDARSNYWAIGAPMLEARTYPLVVPLRDGSILVAGGSRNGQPLSSAERFYPDGQTWVSAGEMSSPRTYATATLLRDGRVLVAGGGSGPAGSPSTTATADLFDPETGKWSRTAEMKTARAEHVATLLPSGEVLVAGGATAYSGPKGTVLATAEIWDPASGSWRAAAPMSVARYHHVAAPLPDGRVLVAGGWSFTRNDDPSLASVEIYDPVTGAWSAAPPMSDGRARARCLTLRDGRILVLGGVAPRYRALATAELFVPGSGGMSGPGQWQPAGQLAAAVMWPAAAMLLDGRVLAAGGGLDSLGSQSTSASALYTPRRPVP